MASTFPDLSPYNYAGNKPINKIDIDGLQEQDKKPTNGGEDNKATSNKATPPASGKELMKSTPQIDMTNAPNPTSYTSEGAPRDKTFFWKEHQKIEPNSLSKSNLYRINELDLAPKVDKTWIESHPEHAAYKGEVLHHHHIDQGKMATAVPAKAHYDFFSELHPKLKAKVKGALKGSKIKGLASAVPSILGELGDIAAMLNGNPDNFYWYLIPPSPKVGQVQFDPDNLLYFTPTEINKTYWEGTTTLKSVSMSMQYYTGFAWDEDAGKYVGVDYEKTVDVRFFYNKDGKVKSTGRIY